MDVLDTAQNLSTGGKILGISVVFLVLILVVYEMKERGKTSTGPTALAARRVMAARVASQPRYVQSYVGQGPPATGYAAVSDTYSGEWEASAEAPYESGPGLLQGRLSALQAFNNVKASGGALAPPERLQGRAGGVAYVDGVDIPRPILRHQSMADTGFHGKAFDDSTNLLSGVV